MNLDSDDQTFITIMQSSRNGQDSPFDGGVRACEQSYVFPEHDRSCSNGQGRQKMNTLLDYALSYAMRGWPVLPLHTPLDDSCSCRRPACPNTGKHPRTAHGLSDASTDPVTIEQWWQQWPDANIGIVTGPESGLIALDIDPRHGGNESFKDLESQNGRLPTTLEVLTGGGGRHFYFKYPEEAAIGNSNGKLGPGLDIKGRQGYVVAPPSLHASGDTYRWEPEHDPQNGVLASLPAWLLVGIKNSADHPLETAGKVLEDIPQGQRNDKLTSLAGTMRRPGMSEAAILAALETENATRCRPPLPMAEVKSIVKSVMRYPAQPSGIGIDSAWSEPMPLAAKVEPDAYPIDALPEIIRSAVEEVQSFTKAPLPIVASSAIAAVSLATQAHVDVERADKLTGPVGLFMLTIAESGERKSTCDQFFTSAISQYECARAEEAKPDLQRHAGEIAAWEAQREGLLAAIRQARKSGKLVNGKSVDNLYDEIVAFEQTKPLPPKVLKLIRGDETPENLAWSLRHEWPSAGVITAEAGIVFGAHAMGKDSIMRNLGLLNVLWDGGKLSIGRRTSESFTVSGARLTVGLQVQEATLRSFFHQSGALARGTGFLARFLVAWPESTQGFRSFTEAPQAWPSLERFNQRITEILNIAPPLKADGTLLPGMLSLAPAAKAAWVAFHDEIEKKLRTGGELYDVRDVASKAADNVARLAALFHQFGSNSSNNSGSTIAPEHIEAASRIVAWHLNESRRFFGELSLPSEMGDAIRLDNWMIDYCLSERTHSVPTKKVQQFGPSGLRKKATIEAAMHELEEHGRARLVQEGHRKIITVNPALLKRTDT